jgi:hypothetical protein
LQLVDRPTFRHDETDYLPERVNTGIGSPGGFGYHARTDETLQGRFELTLSGSYRRLELPPC